MVVFLGTANAYWVLAYSIRRRALVLAVVAAVGCSDPDGFPQIQCSPSICQLSTFSVSWDGLFNTLTVDSGYGQAQIPTQTINGITLTNSPWGSYASQIGLRQPGRAVAQTVR